MTVYALKPLGRKSPSHHHYFFFKLKKFFLPKNKKKSFSYHVYAHARAQLT